MSKSMRSPGSWNFKKEETNEFGCRGCAHNSMGFCEIYDREIPITYANHNSVPKWCEGQYEKR